MLPADAAQRLAEIGGGLRSRVEFEAVLRARTTKEMKKALVESLGQAADYYVESAMVIWRALGHDYSRLLQFSRASSKAVEGELFQRYTRLERRTLVATLTGVRVMTKVGEWVLLSEEHTPPAERVPPFDYLDHVLIATFLTACLMSHVQGEVETARPSNLEKIAKELLEISKIAYDQAVRDGLYPPADEPQLWYWSPSWQEGEVEADLDRRLARVKQFKSAEALVRDFRGF